MPVVVFGTTPMHVHDPQIRRQLLVRKLLAFAAVIGLLAPATVSAQDEKNIVQVAAGADDFSTLVAAVKAAGLVDTLSGEGPYTVLAPTNEAFAKLGDAKIAELLKPENKEMLKGILMYHVIEGKVEAADVAKLSGKEVDTCCPDGNKLEIKVADGKVMFMGGTTATVVKADIEASNGVIHAIDTVLLPPDAE